MTLLAEFQVGRTDGWLYATGSGLSTSYGKARFGGPFYLIPTDRSACTSSTSSPVPTRAARRCSCSSTRGCRTGASTSSRCSTRSPSACAGSTRAVRRARPVPSALWVSNSATGSAPCRHSQRTVIGSPRTTASPAISTSTTRTHPCFRAIPSGVPAVEEAERWANGPLQMAARRIPGCSGRPRPCRGPPGRRRPDGIPPLQARIREASDLPVAFQPRLPVESGSRRRAPGRALRAARPRRFAHQRGDPQRPSSSTRRTSWSRRASR